ncbi:MAG: hypothetical protein JK586_12115 [Nocardiopsis sp. BM-2018]|uniref:ABC-type antimicrobial peptide transport system permease subunit n=1 Tax=Nocardiopsis metallicus TaxID=179819 RepID=A0A840WER8_9ACTN|nr:hypothetical protein [Nocardiopsis metallicus]MBB5495479.1 ABC-type antimicrobial peptide transport system permease subunit [Nocardiopsis metallicus]QRN79106.1 MAG: hypothetical protein JK586_12115 [Nocardiopsis sp. BM-2018]
MNTRAKPGSVVTVLVLLILIAVYQIFYGLFSLVGAAAIESGALDDMLPPGQAEQMEELGEYVWAAYLGAAFALAYGIAAVVLAVLVGKGRPQARTASIGVNAAAGVIILALLIAPAYSLGAIISALFAFTVVALLYNRSAKEYFTARAADPVVG